MTQRLVRRDKIRLHSPILHRFLKSWVPTILDAAVSIAWMSRSLARKKYLTRREQEDTRGTDIARVGLLHASRRHILQYLLRTQVDENTAATPPTSISASVPPSDCLGSGFRAQTPILWPDTRFRQPSKRFVCLLSWQCVFGNDDW